MLEDQEFKIIPGPETPSPKTRGHLLSPSVVQVRREEEVSSEKQLKMSRRQILERGATGE